MIRFSVNRSFLFLAKALAVCIMVIIAFYFGRHSTSLSTKSSTITSTNANLITDSKILTKKPVKKDIYTCPMHPAITSDKPGQCPICHMDLQKIDDDDDDAAAAAASGTPHKASTVPGRASFSLSRYKQQLIGVTTAKVEFKNLTHQIRASGQVAFDPDLFTAIEEFRQALQASAMMKNSSVEQVKSQTDLLLESSKTKLRLLGLNSSQINRLSNDKMNPMNLILPSGSVWIYAEVYEYELRNMKIGQSIEVEAASVPGKVFLGNLKSISPILNAQTRTARIRATVPDPQKELRPESFVTVKINQNLGKRLLVPVDSILHSGDQDYVFMVKGEGEIIPTPVRTGLSTAQWTEIISGVSEGETVATAANFLLDSESRLRSVAQGTTTENSTEDTPNNNQHNEMNHKGGHR